MSNDLLRLHGSPGSPCTRKMLALLRDRRVPYRYAQGNDSRAFDLPEPKVRLFPVFYFTDDQGELTADVDMAGSMLPHHADVSQPDEQIAVTVDTRRGAAGLIRAGLDGILQLFPNRE